MRRKNDCLSQNSSISKARMFVLTLMLLLSTYGWAQNIKVKGTVVDNQGSSIPGVSIAIKGTSMGTITDIDGKFNIDAESGQVLVISFIGYATQEIAVSAESSSLSIKMEPDVIGLEEVVAIGYGVQRKGDVTSAVASVKSEDFLVGNTQNAAELIKGKVAGLVITKASGDPNASSSINLRGMVSWNGSSEPLVLIDGLPGSLNSVAPENIASMDVLKDASAAAIYGTRGASGVIIITTKTGKRDQEAKVSYSGYYTVSEFYKTMDFMGPDEIRAGKTKFIDDGYDTDWLKAITQKAYTQNHSATVTGGTKNATYSANITYREEQGKIKSTGNDNLRISFDLNQYFLNDMVKLNLNIVKGLNTNEISDPGYAYRQALIRNPTSPVYDRDGSYREDYGVLQYYNPVSILEEKIGENREEWTRLNSNLTVEPIKGWKTSLKLATRRSFSNDKTYTTSQHYYEHVDGKYGEAYQKAYNSQRDNLEATTTYESNINSHRFSGVLGYSYEDGFSEDFNAKNYGFLNDYSLYSNMGAGEALANGDAEMGSSKNSDRLIGFIGRVSYGFKNKYNVLASIRREGSSKFGEDHKWGNFPAVSLGWTLSNEGFMQGVDWLNNMKLRAGYGVTGVIPKDSYLSIVKYDLSSEYYDGITNTWNKGLTMENNPNPDLKWETSEEYNVGLDFSVLNNRLSFSANYYLKTTSDMLYEYTVPVPPNRVNTTWANVGELENKGFDILIEGTPFKQNDFEWSTSITLSHNENKVLSLSNNLYKAADYLYTHWAGDPISQATHRVEPGKSMGQFWGRKSVGLTEDGVWLIEDPVTGEAVRFDATITDEETGEERVVKSSEYYEQYLGSGLPKLNLGWSNSFKYKDFDLNLQMSGQFGQKILNGQRMFYQNNSIAYNRLKNAGDDIYGVAPLANDQVQTWVSYFLEDGDYLKMDNITLGYNLKQNKYISNLRIYAAVENAFCITNYSGLDPEMKTDFKEAGYDDRDKYPSIRSYTIGVNITF